MKDYYTQPGINASTLKLFAGDWFHPTTALYKMRNPSPPSQSMALGTAVHSILEHEMDVTEAEQVIADAYKTPKSQDEWLNTAIIMAENVWANCSDVTQHPDAVREKAYFVDGYKALIDLSVGDKGCDYKSTRVTTMAECKKEADKWNLEVQAYHYCMVGGFKSFEFLFVSSVEPHQVFRLLCSQEYLEDFAKPRWTQALERYYEYKDQDLSLVESGVLEVPKWYEEF